MRRTCARLAAVTLLVTGIATIVGRLAPWWPAADVTNHFKPLLLATSVAGLVLLAFGARTLAACRYRLIALGLGLAAVAVVNAAPLQTSLATAAVAAHGRTGTLTIVSFNVFTGNRQLEHTARWLREQNADVIVLQEMTRAAREAMKRALAATHPYVHDCNCNDIVIYSRQPWRAAGGQSRSDERPALSWLTLAGPDGREVRVVGLHPHYNPMSYRYIAQYDWLVRHIRELGDRVILVGDFNAAPWSWQMTRLATAAGLRRHGTFAASWPSLLPVLLIDNVLTTPDIKGVSFRTGPFLGSDHLPVVATVALR